MKFRWRIVSCVLDGRPSPSATPSRAGHRRRRRPISSENGRKSLFRQHFPETAPGAYCARHNARRTPFPGGGGFGPFLAVPARLPRAGGARGLWALFQQPAANLLKLAALADVGARRPRLLVEVQVLALAAPRLFASSHSCSRIPVGCRPCLPVHATRGAISNLSPPPPPPPLNTLIPRAGRCPCDLNVAHADPSTASTRRPSRRVLSHRFNKFNTP